MKKCFDYETKTALWRKYDFKYLAPSTHPSDSVNCSVPTDTTSKEGLSKFSTENSTQGSTLALDPKVTTNATTGESQFTSSWGDCSMLGQVGDDKRDAFVVSNWEALRQEIALGSGDHLTALVYLSGCSPQVYDAYVDGLRTRYGSLQDAATFKSTLETLLQVQPMLQAGCHQTAMAPVDLGRPT